MCVISTPIHAAGSNASTDEWHPHRILVQSPDDFLTHQYHLNPDMVAEKIDTQASAIGQQRSALLDLLARTLPAFVELLKERQNRAGTS